MKQWERTLQAKQREVAETRKKVESMSLEELMQARGMDPDKYAEERLIAQLQRAQLSPEQQELQTTKQKLAEYEELTKKVQQEAQMQEEARIQTQERQKITSEFTEAWRESGLPAHPYFGAKIAAELYRAEKNGVPLTMKEAAGKIKSDWITHAKEVFGKLEPKQLQDVLGEDLLKKWRQFDVSRVQGAQPKTPPQKSPASSAASGKKTSVTEAGWRTWKESGQDFQTWKAANIKNKDLIRDY